MNKNKLGKAIIVLLFLLFPITTYVFVNIKKMKRTYIGVNKPKPKNETSRLYTVIKFKDFENYDPQISTIGIFSCYKEAMIGLLSDVAKFEKEQKQPFEFVKTKRIVEDKEMKFETTLTDGKDYHHWYIMRCDTKKG